MCFLAVGAREVGAQGDASPAAEVRSEAAAEESARDVAHFPAPRRERAPRRVVRRQRFGVDLSRECFDSRRDVRVLRPRLELPMQLA